MEYIKKRMKKFPGLKDSELLEMYPELTQDTLKTFRNQLGETNVKPSRKSIFGSTKTNK